jgi:hypothetical protein
MVFVIDLSELILAVQVSLSDLPENYCSDDQIYFDLKTAKTYIDDIVYDDITHDSMVREATTRLGAYLTYMNYTSLAERKLGEVPQSMQIKVDALRKMALMLMKRITLLKLNDDLTVDDSVETKSKTVAACIMATYLN